MTDPELQQAVKGFIAQEATHRHQHRMLNDRLQEMGYPIARIDRHVTRLLAKLEKVFSTEMALAGTAALEHYTATLAELLLTDDEMLDLLGRSDVRPIPPWHAFEECEHKAVAFDVFQAVGEPATGCGPCGFHRDFPGRDVFQTLRSMARDRASYNPRRLLRSLNEFRKSLCRAPRPVVASRPIPAGVPPRRLGQHRGPRPLVEGTLRRRRKSARAGEVAPAWRADAKGPSSQRIGGRCVWWRGVDLFPRLRSRPAVSNALVDQLRDEEAV